jgi:hypothetical protein
LEPVASPHSIGCTGVIKLDGIIQCFTSLPSFVVSIERINGRLARIDILASSRIFRGLPVPTGGQEEAILPLLAVRGLRGSEETPTGATRELW